MGKSSLRSEITVVALCTLGVLESAELSHYSNPVSNYCYFQAELKVFLDKKVKEQQVCVSNGEYQLPK